MALLKNCLLVIICLPALSTGSFPSKAIVRDTMQPRLAKEVTESKYVVMVTDAKVSRAHIKAFIAIADEFKQRNHTVALAAMSEISKNWLKEGVFNTIIKLKSSLEYSDPENETARQIFLNWMTNYRPNRISYGFRGLNFAYETMKSQADFLYEGAYMSMKREFAAKRPDLVVCDWLSLECAEYAKEAAIPYVVITSTSRYPVFPEWPSYFVLPSSDEHTPYSVSFFNRFEQTFIFPFAFIYYLVPVIFRLNNIRSKVGATPYFVPSYPFVHKHIFVSSYLGLEIPRYVSPFLHTIGPIVAADDQIMDSELKIWLDGIAAKPEEAVVFMAFGSISKVESWKLREIIHGILFEDSCSGSNGRLKNGVHLLWAVGAAEPVKVLSKEILANPDRFHLKMVKWAPQIQILKHDAVRLFVFHGGLESTLECNFAAKPMLVSGLFGDQPFHARRAEELGFGLRLTSIVSAKEVCEKSTHLLDWYSSNDTFRRTLDKMAKIVYYTSQGYRRAVDVMEMEMMVGSDHLVPIEDEWPFYRIHNLDVIFTGLFIIFFFIYLISQCLNCHRGKTGKAKHE